VTLVKREHPEARAELREAVIWYEEQRRYLGDDFYDAIDAAIQLTHLHNPHHALAQLLMLRRSDQLKPGRDGDVVDTIACEHL